MGKGPCENTKKGISIKVKPLDEWPLKVKQKKRWRPFRRRFKNNFSLSDKPQNWTAQNNERNNKRKKSEKTALSKVEEKNELEIENSMERELMQAKIRFLAKKLERNPYICDLNKILSARVPILKVINLWVYGRPSIWLNLKWISFSIFQFTHVTTGLSCDISFKNETSILNSEFLRMVSSEIDERIKLMVIFIR